MTRPWRPKRKPIPGARGRDWILPVMALFTVAVFAVIGAAASMWALFKWMEWI